MAALFPVHGLAQAMDSVLQHVLESCEGVIIAFRQKALKALAQIVEQDPAIFLEERVRKAVEKRLMDNSPAVRDAALEMLGRYVTYRPDLAVQYLARICERSTVCLQQHCESIIYLICFLAGRRLERSQARSEAIEKSLSRGGRSNTES